MRGFCKKFVTIITLSIILFSFNSCKSSSPSPEEEKPAAPGRRDYNWTIDTIIHPSSYLTRFWGTSSTDLWASGSGPFIKYNLWHFNGKTWEQGNILFTGRININSIFGFSNNNIWIGGDVGKILHWNGIEWSESLQFSSTGYRIIDFNGIWGDSPDNIYAVGAYDSLINNRDHSNGLIFHYDGSKWDRVNIKKNDFQFHKIFKEKNGNGLYYLLGCCSDYITLRDTLKFFEFNGKSIREIYSQLYTDYTSLSMTYIDGKIYYVINNDICRYVNGKFEIKKTINGINRGYILSGRSENDLFFAMPDGIVHYNGTDLQYIYKKPESSLIWDAFVFENEVFFLIDSNKDKSYIVKGILKQ